MENRDKRTDAYIAKSAVFAQPVLHHLRELIHRACPEVKETVKWGVPYFEHKGNLAGMAAFKQHCSFIFWKASLMRDPHKIFSAPEEGMGNLGKIKSMNDLPADDILLSYIREAVELNDKGVKLPRNSPAAESHELKIPDYFIKALSANQKAMKTFEQFSYSHKKEYVEWITEAKTEKTRDKRLDTALEWLSEGKKKNWKYI